MNEQPKCAHANAWGLVCGHVQRAHAPSKHPLMGGQIVCNDCARNPHALSYSSQDAGDGVHEFASNATASENSNAIQENRT